MSLADLLGTYCPASASDDTRRELLLLETQRFLTVSQIPTTVWRELGGADRAICLEAAALVEAGKVEIWLTAIRGILDGLAEQQLQGAMQDLAAKVARGETG